MGSGKTTVGRALARRLRWRFVDLDREVERRTGIAVPVLFARRGEPAFRRLEHRVLRAAVERPRCVIAAGGGAPTYPPNRRPLARAGLTVYLRVSVRELARRLGSGAGRPLLAPARGRPAAVRRLIAALLRRREPAYRLADVTVPARGDGATRVAARVAALRQVRELHGRL